MLQEEEVRTVTLRGKEVKIEAIMLEDHTDKTKITLWRDLADFSVRPGDYIQVTDVVANTSSDTTSLLTTKKVEGQGTYLFTYLSA